MKKILPMTYPPITSFQGYANQLAILSSYPEAQDWIYEHYIELMCNIERYGNKKKYTYKNCFFSDIESNLKAPYISHCKAIFPYTHGNLLLYNSFPILLMLENKLSIIQQIKNILDSNRYIYLKIVTNYINAYKIKNRVWKHHTFLYGYDDAFQTIYFADFVQGKYTFAKCTYDELERAILSNVDDYRQINHEIQMVRFMDYECRYNLDMNEIRRKIKNYLYPEKYNRIDTDKFIEKNVENEWVFRKVYQGIDIYDCLIGRTLNWIHSDSKWSDFKLHHCLYDHKELMLKRFEYLYKKNLLKNSKRTYSDKYKIIRDNSLEIRDKILKSNIANNKKELLKIPEKLKEMKMLEKVLLEKIFF